MDSQNILNRKPVKGKEVFIAPNATLIGDITLGDEVSVWFGAVIRADTDSIKIGSRSNVQDNSVLHVDPGFPISIGHDVVIGHSAVIHGATIGNHVLIGMRSTVLNKVSIGDFCIIGANALLTEGMQVPEYSLVLGSPAKIISRLREDQVEKVKKNAEAYVKLSKEYLNNYTS
jgi:carbonic anhydrase/acetyltransferase-like protein (isoleucine patch superfamily)